MRQRLTPEARRQQLLEVAYHCFSEQGYIETTVADLVKRANVAKGTFFYYFPTKEDVLMALMHNECEVILTNIKPMYENESALTKLNILLTVLSEPNRMEQIVDRLYEQGEVGLVKSLWDVVTEYFHHSLVECIQQGCKEGTMHCTDVEICVSYFWYILDCMYTLQTDEYSYSEWDRKEAIGIDLIKGLLGIEVGLERDYRK